MDIIKFATRITQQVPHRFYENIVTDITTLNQERKTTQ